MECGVGDEMRGWAFWFHSWVLHTVEGDSGGVGVASLLRRFVGIVGWSEKGEGRGGGFRVER